MAKQKTKTITDEIGPVRVDHHAYLVRRGQLDLAVKFFVEELKWREYRAPISGDWGTARFLHLPHTDSRIQLTEYNSPESDSAKCTDDHHLGLATVSRIEAAVQAICSWAIHNDVGDQFACDQANAEGTKWFIYLPEIFTFAIEVVQVKAFPTP